MTADTTPETPVPEVFVTPVAYQAGIWPDGEESINAGLFTVRVEYRGRGKWAVLHGARRCLGSDGEWDWESIPSEREDDWLATHRFTLEEALELARKHAPRITVNGMTAFEVRLRELGGLEVPR